MLRPILAWFTLAVLALTCAGEEPSVLSMAGEAEGLWRMVPGDAIFRVEADPLPGSYKMYVVYSPDLTVPEDAFMGTMTALAAEGTYDVSIVEKPGRESSRTKHLIAEFDSDGHRLLFRPYKPTASFSLVRWIPYLFRVGFRQGHRPQGYDGAVRVGSETPVVL